MAKPRIFLSSTYFDLKSVRADLEHFIREQGYDPVLHERGSVPYGNKEALEEYCYREIESCDVLVSIVGGRFGSKSADSHYSISQTELRVALELSRQVYVFVDQSVFHEYRTYEKNRDSDVKWAAVDNPRIYEFLREVYGLKNNNPIQPFETSYDIVAILREQWAGLFQRLLAQQALGVQASMFNDLRQSLETARALVDVVSSEADRRDEVVSSLILLNHPLFAALKSALKVPYRFVVESISELEDWLNARGFREDPNPFSDEIEFSRTDKSMGVIEVISISREIFDQSGQLKPYNSENWSEGFVKSVSRPIAKVSNYDDLDDDIPF